MRERPILFSAPMVRALLAGTKTQTRRVVKPQPPAGWDRNCWFSAPVWGWTAEGEPSKTWHKVRCPYGQPGDRLWVRETWQAVNGNDRARHIMTHPRPNIGWLEYAATPRDDEPAYKWRPSIHMPRWASRITLEVTGVRVERLQDISEADAIAEGVEKAYVDAAGRQRWRMYPHQDGVPGEDVATYVGPSHTSKPIEAFKSLWLSINGPGSWDANPWVWLVEFRRLT